MTYNLFGGTLNLAQSIYHCKDHRTRRERLHYTGVIQNGYYDLIYALDKSGVFVYFMY